MKRSSRIIVAALGTACAIGGGAGPALAQTAEVRLAVKVSAAAGRHVPVCARIDLPEALRSVPVEEIFVSMKCDAGGEPVPGQVVADGKETALWWVLPEAAPGTSRWTATLSSGPYSGKDVFAFQDTAGKHLDLRFAGRPVTRYMYEYDTSTKEQTHDTYKPFHHVFDAAGEDVITKGAGGHDTHHRGIFIGWNRLACGAQKYDFWSMGGGSAQVHRKFLQITAGPVLGRCVALIEWVDKDGKVIVSEERETTCFRQPGPAIMLMEFRAKLLAAGGDVVLDGNPEHGGFQYRAHNDVAVKVGATGGKQTADSAPEEFKTQYEFHKDGIKTAAQKLNENADLPWAAECYALRGKRYSVQHMNHPSNPKGTIYSAYRQYGRFGAYFKTELKAGGVLPLVYRIYAVEGPMPPREEMNLRHAAFTEAPVVEAAR